MRGVSVTDSGPIHYICIYIHICFCLTKTDTSCCQIKMGMVEYLGVDHHMFNKTDTTCQQVNLEMVAYLGAV